MKIRHIGTFALLLPVIALAQTPPSIALKNFSERLTKDVPVSGRVLVGAAIKRSTAFQLSDPMLRIDGASSTPFREGVCVSFASRDGQYAGQGFVDAASLRGFPGPVKLTIDRSRDAKAFLAKLAPDELAALAEDGTCERGSTTSGTQRIIALDPAAAESAPISQLALYVNSGGLPTVLRQLAPQGGTIPCHPVEKGRRIAYDKICLVPVSSSQRGVSLQIERTRYERALTPVTFDVTW